MHVIQQICYCVNTRRVRKKNKQEGKKTKSCYRDIKDVYTIVLFETSPSQLHKFRDVYLHHFEQKIRYRSGNESSTEIFICNA